MAPPITRRTALIAGGITLASAGLAAPALIGLRRRSGTVRRLASSHAASPHVDGAGVKLDKLLGSRTLPLLDPFLMLDRFRSKDPDDFIRGFPDHPHRGFETVSIVVDGHVRHADSVGNRGDIAAGGVQWMTAGHGIVHSEMLAASEQSGELWGYQLWVNLPARLKMTKPRYQDLAASAFSTAMVADATVRVLAGRAGRTRGAVDGIYTQPTLLDVDLEPGARFIDEIPVGHTAFVVVARGEISVGEEGAALHDGELGVLGPGDTVAFVAAERSRVLVFAGAPIGEPIARRGPFVMNTDAEIRQAFQDYRSGRLVSG